VPRHRGKILHTAEFRGLYPSAPERQAASPSETQPRSELSDERRQELVAFAESLEPETTIEPEFVEPKGVKYKMPDVIKALPDKEARKAATKKLQEAAEKRRKAATERKRKSFKEKRTIVVTNRQVIADARDKLDSLADDRGAYEVLWEALPDLIRDALPDHYPGKKFETPAAPRERPPARKEPSVRRKEPPEPAAPEKRSVRPLKPEPPTEAKPAKVETKVGTLRLTPAMFARQGIGPFMSQIVKALRAGKVVTVPGKGTITAANFGKLTVSWQAEPIGKGGKIETLDELTPEQKKRLDTHRKKLIKAGKPFTFPDWLKDLYKEKPGLQEFFAENTVEIPEAAVSHAFVEPPVAERSAIDRAVAALRKYFAKNGKDAASLVSLGMPADTISALEKGGFAKHGTMTAAEFAAWEKHRFGVAPPAVTSKAKTPVRTLLAEGRKSLKGLKENIFERTRKEREAAKEGKADKRRERFEEVRKTKTGPKGEAFKARHRSQLLQEAERQLLSTTAITDSAFPVGTALHYAEEMVGKTTELQAATIAAPEETGKSAYQLISDYVKGRIDAVLEKFAKDFEGRQKALDEEIARQHSLAIRLQEEMASEFEVEHAGKHKGKSWQALTKELPNAHYKASLKERARHERKEDSNDPILWEIGDINRQVGILGRFARDRKANATALSFLKTRRIELRQRRIDERKLLDALKSQEAKATAKETANVQRYIEQLLDTGKVDADRAAELKEIFSLSGKYAKRAMRSRETTPIIREVLDSLPPPMFDQTIADSRLIHVGSKLDLKAHRARMRREKKYGKAAAPQRVILGSREVYDQLSAWGGTVVDAITAKLKEAGYLKEKGGKFFPTSPDRYDNSPEENVYLFLSRKMKTLPSQIGKGRIKSTDELKRGIVKGKQSVNSMLTRGAGLVDAWQAATYVTPPQDAKAKRRFDKLPEREKWLKRLEDIELTNNLMFEADPALAKPTKYIPPDTAERLAGASDDIKAFESMVLESKARWEGEKTGEKATDWFKETVRGNKGEGQIADQLRKIFGAKPMHPLNKPEAEVPTGLTGAQALDRFVKNIPGVAGIKAFIRNFLIPHLKALVGDVPVEFINNAHMRSYFPGRGDDMSPGFYSPEHHKIFLHEGLLDHPKELAETIMEEMIHAATVYAIHNNIRGTREIIHDIMEEFRRNFGEGQHDYALSKPEEFIAHALNDGELQYVLKHMRMSTATRAKVRALGKGRDMPSMWDWVVAAVANAIGVKASMLDAVISMYPNLAMSTAEQRAHRKAGPAGRPGLEKEIFGAKPFNFDAKFIKDIVDGTVDWRIAGRQKFNQFIAPGDHLVRQNAQEHFEGDMNNPFARAHNVGIAEHQRNIETEMNEGDIQLNALLRWIGESHSTRWAQAGKAMMTLLEASLAKVDPTRPLADNKWIRDDAQHPTRKKRTKPTQAHKKATYQRAAWERFSKEWAAYPPELRALLEPVARRMTRQMEKFERKFIRNLLRAMVAKENGGVELPSTITEDQAIEEIYTGKISDDLKTALGKNAKTLMESIGRFGLRGSLYWPAFRKGEFFISGKRRIPVPTVTRGNVLLDQHARDTRDLHSFIFDNEDDAIDYIEEIGDSGDERLINPLRTTYINPITGEQVTPKDAGRINGVDWQAQPIYHVDVQDRFMAMGTMSQLLRQKAALEKDGDWTDISVPIEAAEANTTSVNAAPQQLAALLRNIDSMSGIEDSEKRLMRQGAVYSFAKNQQGNRITKRLLHRTGVYGHVTDTKDLFDSLRVANEMLSRHVVSLDRIPQIRDAMKELMDYVKAASSPTRRDYLDRLSPELQAMAGRQYGKDNLKPERLAADAAELKRRIDGTMQAKGGPMRGEALLNALKSVVVMKFLYNPIYFAIQSLGLPMQAYPGMVFRIWQAQKGIRMGAFSAAQQYLGKGMADVGLIANYRQGVSEWAAEVKDLAAGFKPRPGWLERGRGVRRPFDYIAELKKRLAASSSKYKDLKAAALQRAYDRGLIGQAGLEQQNLRLDMMGAGAANKFYRGVEHSMRTFRALQEGIEINNRAAPLMGYVEYYKDIGYTDEQAIELAINNVFGEQVGYQNWNWPAAMGHPLAAPAMLFHKFAFRQALNFWGSFRRAIRPGEGDSRGAAIAHLLTMTAVLAVVGGFSGNPLWEPIRLLMYLFGMSENWDASKTSGEAWMADYLGETMSEAAMYGLPRLLGFDLSSRVALDSTLFYQQPKEMTQQAWLAVLGTAYIGAPGSTAFESVKAMYDLVKGDQSWPKWLGQTPMPSFMRNIFKGYDVMANGPTTATGVSTGKPPGILEGVANMAGVRTRSQYRPFEQGSAAKYRQKRLDQDNKNALTQRILNQGLTSGNMSQVRAYNRGRPAKERITVKSINEARKRRRATERDIRKENR